MTTPKLAQQINSSQVGSVYGVRCDAITRNGKRCANKNSWWIPCAAVYDVRCTSYRAEEFKPVCLCRVHASAEWKARKEGRRLKLHHGGWLGGFNRSNFGNLVINRPFVNWDTIKSFKVPKYWRIATQ